MSEPRRLLEDGSARARTLLAAAKRDTPSRATQAATLASLGLATAGTSWLLHAWTLLKHAAASKVTLSAVALVTAASGGYLLGRTEHHAQPETAVSPSPSPIPTPIPSPIPIPIPIPSPNLIPTPSLSLTPTPSPTPTLSPMLSLSPTPTVTSTPSPSPSAILADELDAIRRARADVLAKDGAAALAELESYRAKHPGGTFEEEALALRIRAHRLIGATDAAARELDDLRTRYPSSVHLQNLEKNP